MAEPPKFCPRCGDPLTTGEASGRARRLCARAGCGYVHWDNPVPVVAAIVEHPEGILLVRNVGWPAAWFGLVTGFLERDETPEQGVLREIAEELGLTGEIVGFVGVYPFFQMNQVILAYHVRASGTVAVGEELEAYKAVPLAKLRPWALGTGLAVRDWLAQVRPETPPAT